MAKKLKLLANSLGDLNIFSAVLQDAALKVGDMAFLPRSRRFAAVANRYFWEGGSDKKTVPQRRRTGFHFDGVLKAAYQNLPIDDPDHVLELLAIEATQEDDGTYTATLVFAGFAALRLELECIDASLEDLSDPWPAIREPRHDLGPDEPAAGGPEP